MFFAAQDICYPAQHAFWGEAQACGVTARLRGRNDSAYDRDLFEAGKKLVPKSGVAPPGNGLASAGPAASGGAETAEIMPRPG